MYDRHRQVQLRIVGRATTIVDEGQRRRAWDALPSHSRKVFEVDSAPGDQLTAYDQFAWIRIELHELEWLDLSTQPHERWRLLRGGQGWITERMG